MQQKFFKEIAMLDAYIIDWIKQEEEKKRRDKSEGLQIPLPLYPPDFDGYKEESDKKETPRRGYIEIDIAGDEKDDANIMEL